MRGKGSKGVSNWYQPVFYPLLVGGGSTLKVGSRACNLAVTRLSHNDPIHALYPLLDSLHSGCV